jgi:hypothetical protein
MPKMQPKLTYTLTLTYAEAEALGQFCLRARGAWKIKRESEGSHPPTNRLSL